MIKIFFYRLFQITMKLAAYFLGIKEPKLISEANSLIKAVDVLKEHNLSKPLIITER